MMDYKYIRAWGYMLSSFQYYIDIQVFKAREEQAPEDSIYRKQDGTWARLSEVKNKDTVDRINQILEGWK